MKKNPTVRRGTRRIINAMAPIRVCDLGGWTDTWFADTGAVCNIAVYPYAEVQIYVAPRAPGKPRITIHAENFGDRYQLDPDRIVYDKHPLIEASIDILEIKGLSFEVSLYSAAPAGCSTGTSAAVTVALLGALDMLSPGRRTPHEIAALAHRVETEKLGLQCGIQDQICSAYGGLCFIEMFKYPLASVSQLAISNSLWWEIERRLVLVYLGRTHSSSEVHGRVIKKLEKPGSDKSVLEKLRRCAYAGKDALLSGNLKAFGRAMIANTEAQAELHLALVSEPARHVIELARKHGAAGWKVNGAGGEGGSLTVLCGPEGGKKRAFIQELERSGMGCRVIPTYLARIGLRRWETVE
jgi:D-glycero-alpha-D-manno-heptose-7-phosphate kinase